MQGKLEWQSEAMKAMEEKFLALLPEDEADPEHDLYTKNGLSVVLEEADNLMVEIQAHLAVVETNIQNQRSIAAANIRANATALSLPQRASTPAVPCGLSKVRLPKVQLPTFSGEAHSTCYLLGCAMLFSTF